MSKERLLTEIEKIKSYGVNEDSIVFLTVMGFIRFSKGRISYIEYKVEELAVEGSPSFLADVVSILRSYIDVNDLFTICMFNKLEKG